MIEWSDVLKISIPVLIAVIGWSLNEYFQRRWKRHKRKESRYITFLESSSGFYTNIDSKEEAKKKKNLFILQLRLAWLYCPDSVILKAQKFLQSVQTGACNSDEKKERALSEFVLEMRKDLQGKRLGLWSRTKLKASDYRFFTST